MTYDGFIEFNYSIPNDSAEIKDTNLKIHLINDILSEVARSQIGKGADHTNPNKQEDYNFQIRLNLNYDKFSIKSDTGNKGLETGIIITTINNWKLSPRLLEELIKNRQIPPKFVSRLSDLHKSSHNIDCMTFLH